MHVSYFLHKIFTIRFWHFFWVTTSWNIEYFRCIFCLFIPLYLTETRHLCSQYLENWATFTQTVWMKKKQFNLEGKNDLGRIVPLIWDEVIRYQYAYAVWIHCLMGRRHFLFEYRNGCLNSSWRICDLQNSWQTQEDIKAYRHFTGLLGRLKVITLTKVEFIGGLPKVSGAWQHTAKSGWLFQAVCCWKMSWAQGVLEKSWQVTK